MKKIAVVEDEKMLFTALAAELSSDGFAVIGAPDGEAGLALVKKEMPDLVLLDIAP
jgi:DNA-binding response OmpR family regulator